MVRPLKAFVAIFMFALLGGGAAHAEVIVTPADSHPALGGYSPVSYFEAGVPQRGSDKFQASHDGATYFFTSAAQVERFRADPEKYAPVFPYHCPYNLALGRAAAIDPTNFRIVGGRLLVFHRSEEMDGGREWDRHEAREQERLLERARGNFRILKF